MIGKFMQHSVFLQYELILLYIDIYILMQSIYLHIKKVWKDVSNLKSSYPQ